MTTFANINNTAKSKLANLLGAKASEVRVNGGSINATGKIAYVSLSYNNKNISVELPVRNGLYAGGTGSEVYGWRDKNGFTPVPVNFVRAHFA